MLMLALTKNNEIINIKDALLKTDYYCDNCGGILRVKNGKIRVKHFYHLNEDCGSEGESLIHKYWKDYFVNLKEFDGYKITASGKEVSLLKGNYIPDVFLKTNKGTYIIIEICYKNPKTDDYKKFFKILGDKGVEKIYEIQVDFEKILNTKILFDIEIEKRKKVFIENLAKEVERKRQYIIKKYYKDGGLVFNYESHMPYTYFTLSKDLEPKYGYAESKFSKGKYYRYVIRNSLKFKKFKIRLKENLKFGNEYIYVISEPFKIDIYDYKNIFKHLDWYGYLGEFYSTDEELKGNISVILDDEEIKKLKFMKK